MKITVSKQDIQNGNPVNARLCPITLAIKRQYPKFNSVKTFNASVEYYDKENNKKMYKLPRSAIDFVFRFDNPKLCSHSVLKEIKPFSFELTDLLSIYK